MTSLCRKMLQRFRGREDDDEDSGQNVRFDCKAFLDVIEEFKKDFDDDVSPEEKLFVVPDHLKDLVHVFFFHEMQKKVQFRNVPRNTAFVDAIRNPDKEIRFINRLVHDATNGTFEELDPTTRDRIRNPEFRFLLLGIFYLKAAWDGADDGSRTFRNRNGEFPHVPFFRLNDHPVEFKKGRVHVKVPYELDPDKYVPGSFVVFSKPCSRWDKKYLYANAHLPKLELEGRREADAGSGKVVVNFKYKQDETGFEASCLFAHDSVDGEFEPRPVADVYFDEPFRIEIYSRRVKVFEVEVFNLSSDEGGPFDRIDDCGDEE